MLARADASCYKTAMDQTPTNGGRRASIERNTTETRIRVALKLDGTGVYDVKTGVGFLDHMLEQLSRHSLMDLTVLADGDLQVEDVGTPASA